MIHLIIQRLKASTDVTDITTADRIFPLIRLQGSQVPALVVQLVGGAPTETKEETSHVDDNLIEITALAKQPAQAWALSQAVRDSLDGYTSGTLADVRFQTHASDIFESTDVFTITTRYLVRTQRDGTTLPTAVAGLGYDLNIRGALSFKIEDITATAGGSTALTEPATTSTYFVEFSVGGGNGTHTLTLPDTRNLTGRAFRIMTGSSISNQKKVEIVPASGDSATIDGAASHELTRAYDGIMLIAHSSNWYIVQRKSKT